jgi:hypothetical protein
VCDIEETEWEWVRVTGYLKLPAVIVGPESSYDLYLSDSPEVINDDGGVEINIKVGDGPNEVRALPKEYRDEDLKVETYNGLIVGHRDAVTIWGILDNKDKDFCEIEVKMIEKGWNP